MPANPLDEWFTGQPPTQQLPPAIQGSPGLGTSGGLMTPGPISPPGLQIPPGQGNSPFGWRMPGRRIPMPVQNPIEGANRQAMIAQALQGFNNQYPNWQQQINQPVPPIPQAPLDPYGFAGGQIGMHGQPLYQGQPIVKGSG